METAICVELELNMLYVVLFSLESITLPIFVYVCFFNLFAWFPQRSSSLRLSFLWHFRIFLSILFVLLLHEHNEEEIFLWLNSRAIGIILSNFQSKHSSKKCIRLEWSIRGHILLCLAKKCLFSILPFTAKQRFWVDAYFYTWYIKWTLNEPFYLWLHSFNMPNCMYKLSGIVDSMSVRHSICQRIDHILSILCHQRWSFWHKHIKKTAFSNSNP